MYFEKMNNRRSLHLIFQFNISVLVFLIFSSTVYAQSEYTNIEWFELMPLDDLETLLNPPDFIFDIEDQGQNDNLNALNDASSNDLGSKKYKQALESTRVVEAFNGKKVKLPGFIVPLDSEEKQRVTQFFIVPYFGACLHMPPPPPNQIIFVKFPAGVELTSLYDAFWFEGTLTIDTTDNVLGKSAYKMEVNKVYPYEE